MPLNRDVPARNALYQNVQYLRKKIVFGNYGAGAITVGKIPAYATVTGGGVHITTAFNSSGTDLIDVGFIGSTTDADAYASALSMAAVGFIAFDELAATTNIMQTIDTTVTCTLTQGAADATAGEGYVIVQYVQAN